MQEVSLECEDHPGETMTVWLEGFDEAHGAMTTLVANTSVRFIFAAGRGTRRLQRDNRSSNLFLRSADQKSPRVEEGGGGVRLPGRPVRCFLKG